MPKAVYGRRKEEADFYKEYFDNALIWVNDVAKTIEIATQESELHGIAAMDALHIAAAYLGEATVLYTTERETKPLYRTSLVRVVML